MTSSRIFEHTTDALIQQFSEGGRPNLQDMIRYPALLMHEGIDNEVAHVVRIIEANVVGRDVQFEYVIDNAVPPLRNSMIFANRADFGITEFEFSRGHWAIKSADLFRTLFRNVRPGRQRPTVFNLPEHEQVDPALASVMMPFGATFAPIYASIQQACVDVGLTCNRADDIWDHHTIIQDIVGLIDRSRIVICDCTGKNPNVFYEAGIAHTLGREVILITQNAADIPFDLTHHRYIPYLNNDEGRAAMVATLSDRMRALIAR